VVSLPFSCSQWGLADTKLETLKRVTNISV
jgi:hypothetical protein